MASNLRVDTILPSSGTTLGIGTASGTINFLGNSNITTTGTINAASATITGNLGVGGTLTYEDVTNIDSVGVITARSNVKVGGSLEMTSGTTTINKNAVGVGTTTTAGRNAGVGTATGTIIYNTNFNALQVYTGSQWNVINTKTPNFAINYLVIGGGGSGGGYFRGGGGGAGALRTNLSLIHI